MPTHQLQVESAHDETPSIRSVALPLGDAAFAFKPGQYALVEIALANGEREDRPLSIACSPAGAGRLLFATRRSDSAFKQAFFRLQPGDAVTVTGPVGRFIYDESQSESVFLSGGIGITPLKSMIEYVADRGLDHRVTLLYGNRTPEEIAFRDDLDRLARKHSNVRIVYVVSEAAGAAGSWKGPVGRIDAELLRRYVDRIEQPRYYVCGPPGMVDGLRQLLAELGAPKARVAIENFDGYD